MTREDFKAIELHEFVESDIEGFKDLFQVHDKTEYSNAIQLKLHRVYDDIIHVRDIYILDCDAKHLRRFY